jgi:hypothetical protein
MKTPIIKYIRILIHRLLWMKTVIIKYRRILIHIHLQIKKCDHNIYVLIVIGMTHGDSSTVHIYTHTHTHTHTHNTQNNAIN